MHKIRSFHLLIFEILIFEYLRVRWSDFLHPFLTIPTSKLFDHLSIYVNLRLHAKNQGISLICSWDVVDWKILQSNWLRIFSPISQKPKCSQMWDLCSNTAYKFLLQNKFNKNWWQKFSINSKLCFWPILGQFSQFLGHTNFLRKIQLYHTQLCLGL